MPKMKFQPQSDLISLYQAVKEAFPLAVYRPKKTQNLFHRSRAATRGLFTSNQYGKTHSGIAEGISIACGFRVWEKPDSPHWRVLNSRGEPMPVPNQVRITTTDFANGLLNALFPKFKALAPSEFYEVQTNQAGFPTKIVWAWGSETVFMSHDQEPMKFESGTFHAVHHDEPPPRAVRVASYRGLMRQAGLEYFTLTPIFGGYLLRDVVKKADGKRIEIFNASIDENRRSQGGVLDDDTVDQFIDMLTEEEKLARVHGKFPGQFGRCVPDYMDEYPQVIPSFRINADDWIPIMCLDPHERKPDCMVWAAFHRREPRVVIYDEIMNYETQGSARKTANAAHRMESDAGITPVRRIIDPRAAQKLLKSNGRTYQQEYAANGLFCVPAPGVGLADGFKRINDWVMGETPYLQVMQHCTHTRAELFGLTWAMKGVEYAKREATEGPDDHIACVRYIAMWSPQINQETQEDEPAPSDQFAGALAEIYDGPTGGAYTGY